MDTSTYKLVEAALFLGGILSLLLALNITTSRRIKKQEEARAQRVEWASEFGLTYEDLKLIELSYSRLDFEIDRLRATEPREEMILFAGVKRLRSQGFTIPQAVKSACLNYEQTVWRINR